MQEIMHSRDGLIALHAFDSTKSDKDLKPSLKPDALKESYEIDLFSRSNAGRFHLLWVNKYGAETKDFLLKTVNATTLAQDHLSALGLPHFACPPLTSYSHANTRNAGAR